MIDVLPDSRVSTVLTRKNAVWRLGAFWVPIYARSAPKLGDFPFFYWFQLIWMPVVMVLCYLAYLLLRTPRTEQASGGQRLGESGEAR